MQTRHTLAFVLVFIFSSTLISVGRVRVLEASGLTIYIREDGSVDPQTAPISRLDNLYAFTDDIARALANEPITTRNILSAVIILASVAVITTYQKQENTNQKIV